MWPCYFLFDIPDGTDEGLVLFQRSGMYGIRKVFEDVINPEFGKNFSDYRLRFLPAVDKEAFEQYTNGKIEAIRFIRYDIPSDLAEIVGGGDKEVQGYVELVVHARKGRNLPINNRVRKFLRSNKKIGDFIALDETNFEYQNVKLTSKLSGTRRTLDLRDPKHLRAYHDISSEVKVSGKSGHPQFESIHGIAQELVERLKAGMYPGGMP